MGVIVGERVSKISADKTVGVQEDKFSVTVGPEVTDVSQKEVTIGGEKKKGLTFDWKFTAKYGENYGQIVVEGSIFFHDAPTVLEELENDWKEKKKIEDEGIRLGIMNRILEVGYINAIGLAEKVKLPPPLQLPRFIPADKEEKPTEAS